MNLVETTVSQLNGLDVGSQIVIVTEGNAITGQLRWIWVSQYHKITGGWPEPTVDLKISMDEEGRQTVDLKNLPLGYRVQIERDES